MYALDAFNVCSTFEQREAEVFLWTVGTWTSEAHVKRVFVIRSFDTTMVKEYDFDKRLEAWREGFAAEWDVEQSKIRINFEKMDPCWIPLKNVEYKIQQVQQDVWKYNELHKTQQYVNLSETITDILVETDKIDVEFSTDRQKKRRELYQQLEKIRTDLLERGGNCTSGSCMECGKVKTAMK